MITDLSWDLYRSFVAVLRAGTLSEAAHVLGISQPTVGRHIDTLEERLGYALFVRSQTGFVPTDAGARLLPYATALDSMAAAFLREASSGENKETLGTVRISASEIIGSEILPPILSKLSTEHPSLKIELVLSNKIEDLLSREADIAVRMGEPEQKALIAKKIGEISLGFHAHKDYLSRRGEPKNWVDLVGHTLIGFDTENEFIREFKKTIGKISRDDFSFRTNSDIAQLAAIRSGIGIGICQTNLAKRDKNLIHILPKLLNLKLPTWLVMHENLKSSRRCSVVYAALSKGLSEYVKPLAHH